MLSIRGKHWTRKTDNDPQRIFADLFPLPITRVSLFFESAFPFPAIWEPAIRSPYMWQNLNKFNVKMVANVKLKAILIKNKAIREELLSP